jgi:hypothetical protein
MASNHDSNQDGSNPNGELKPEKSNKSGHKNQPDESFLLSWLAPVYGSKHYYKDRLYGIFALVFAIVFATTAHAATKSTDIAAFVFLVAMAAAWLCYMVIMIYRTKRK